MYTWTQRTHNYWTLLSCLCRRVRKPPASDSRWIGSETRDDRHRPACQRDRIALVTTSEHCKTLIDDMNPCAWLWTFLGVSFLASLRGCSGIEGGGGETCLTAELLRSLPPEWVEDSEVVRERRPGGCKQWPLVRIVYIHLTLHSCSYWVGPLPLSELPQNR